jgi:hypothetical protein
MYGTASPSVELHGTLIGLYSGSKQEHELLCSKISSSEELGESRNSRAYYRKLQNGLHYYPILYNPGPHPAGPSKHTNKMT